MKEQYMLQRLKCGWMFSYYRPNARCGRSFEILVNELDQELTLIVDSITLRNDKYLGNDSLGVLFDKVNSYNNHYHVERDK
jgi:hypothetical protein